MTVRGIEDFTEALRGLTPKLRKRAVLNALKKGARIVQAAERSVVPVLAVATPYRKPGTVKKAIAVRTSKASRRAGDVGVFVNVKPAQGAKFKTIGTHKVLGKKVKLRVQTKASKRGALSPDDPFYWRFLDLGTRKMRAYRFTEAGVAKLPQALQTIESDLRPQIERLNVNPKDPL